MTEVKNVSLEDFQTYDEITELRHGEIDEVLGVHLRSGLNPTVWRYKMQGTGHWIYTTEKHIATHFGRGTEEGLITVNAAKALLKTRTRSLLKKLHKAPPASRAPTFNKFANPGIRAL